MSVQRVIFVVMSSQSGSRGWGRRLSIFAALGIAVAAAIGGILLLNSNRQRALTPAPAGSPSPDLMTSPSPSAQPLEALVVIMQRTTGNPGSITVGVAPDTVILTRLDGTVVGRTTFKPAQPPLIANAATLLPPQVHALAGAAYYIDGDGVVRRLDRTGAVTVVASFPTTEPQHMTAFAVSPDGTKVMASVLTYGTKGPGLPGPYTIGPSYNNLEIADAGGHTTVLSHTPQDTTRIGQFAVAGWDAGGPLAGNVPVATQNPLPEGWSAPLFHLTLDGKSGDQLGGAGCVAQVENIQSQVLCSTGDYAAPPTQLRTGTGDLVWALPAIVGMWGSIALSPSGDHVASGPIGPSPRHNHVYFRDGSEVTIPDDFYSLAWWDERTLVGYSGDINKPALSSIVFKAHQPGPVQPEPFSTSFYAGFIPAP
jgi:hypothetical protein